mgnify:CR=1 FL=1
MKLLKNIFLLILLTLFTFPAYSELSVEEIIKGRQAIFSENYKTAKRVQALSSDIEFEAAIELMNKMSENYKNLLDYFPENSKEGLLTDDFDGDGINAYQFFTSSSGSGVPSRSTAREVTAADSRQRSMQAYGICCGQATQLLRGAAAFDV